MAIFLWFLQFVETSLKCADFRILFLDFCKILSVLRLKVSITLFQLLMLSLYRATSSSSFVSLPRIFRNASSASRITSGCTLFVQESLRLLACNALLGTLLFADFFAFISPTKVQKNPKYASKIMFIFLIFNSFYERQMRSDN